MVRAVLKIPTFRPCSVDTVFAWYVRRSQSAASNSKRSNISQLKAFSPSSVVSYFQKGSEGVSAPLPISTPVNFYPMCLPNAVETVPVQRYDYTTGARLLKTSKPRPEVYACHTYEICLTCMSMIQDKLECMTYIACAVRPARSDNFILSKQCNYFHAIVSISE